MQTSAPGDMQIVGIATEVVAGWLLRDLPLAALEGIARPDLAAPIAAQPQITARTLRTRTGLRRYQPALRRAAHELSQVKNSPPAWELEALMRAEIGSVIWDFANDIEAGAARSRSHHAGFWAMRVVRKTYVLDPGATTLYVQHCYFAFVDRAVLDGLGRLEMCG